MPRLCYWLVEDSDEFFDVEYYDGVGDEGRDVVARKKDDKGNSERWYFQCKRYKEISYSDFKKEIDKIKKHSEEKPDFKPDVITFVTTCQVSPKIKDKTKEYAKSKGFLKISFWTEVELDKKVKGSSKCLGEFFGGGEYIIASLNLIVAQTQLKEKEFSFEITLRKCPTLPDSFIPRNKWMNQIDSSLKEKSFLYLYGYPKGSKTSIVAEYITYKTTQNYVWYEFKGLGNECFFFIRDIAHFIDIHLEDKGLRTRLFMDKQISVEKITQDLVDLTRKIKEFYIILDNVHLVKDKDPINSFLYSLSKQTGNNIRFILVSEDKTGFENSNWWMNSNSLSVQGFDPDEIKRLFVKEKIDISGFNENVFQFIHSYTCGHPFLIKSLIEGIRRKKVKPIKGIIEKVLQPLKFSKEEEKLSEHLQSKIYDSLLSKESERILFNRLSVLMDNFTQELSDEIAKIPPPIPNSHFIFNSLKKKVLESKSENAFEIPKLFKKIGEDSVSLEEKRGIFKVSGHFLAKPKEGSVNFIDAVWGYEYLLLAEEYEQALRGFIILIIQTIYHNKKDFLNYVLGFCGILELHTKPIRNDLLLDFYSAVRSGYLQLQKYKEAQRVIENINKIPNVEDLTSKSLLFNNLAIQYYGFHHFESQKFMSAIQNLLNLIHFEEESNLDRDLLKAGLFIAAVNVASKGIYIIKSLLELAVSTGISFDEIFEDQGNFELDFFEMLKIGLFKGFHDDILKKDDDLNNVIKELCSILAIFETCKYVKGKILISHLIGTLMTSYGKNQEEARKYLVSAIKYLHENKNVLKRVEIFKANIFVDLGDSFFVEKKFDKAREFFIEIVGEKDSPTEWEFFYFHSLRRLGICQFYLGNHQDAKVLFEKAIKYSLKYSIKYNEFGLQALGELAIFFINIKNYYKAIQCLSLIIRYLKYVSDTKYKILSGHILSWVVSILDENAVGSTLLPTEKDQLKPNFEFFSKNYPKLKDFEIKGTFPALYCMLAEGFKLVKKDSRAIYWYEKALKEKVNTDFDKGAKSLSTSELYKLYLKKKDIANVLKIWFCLLDINAKKFLPDVFIHLINELVKKVENKNQFTYAENILLRFIALAESSRIEEKDKLLNIAYNALGAFYIINNEIDKGTKWWLKGCTLAEKSGLEMIEMDKLYIKISEYLLREKIHLFNDKLLGSIELYFKKKKKIIVSRLDKDINKVVQQSEEGITTLTTFLDVNKELEQLLIDRINEMIREFSALAGKGLTKSKGTFP